MKTTIGTIRQNITLVKFLTKTNDDLEIQDICSNIEDATPGSLFVTLSNEPKYVHDAIRKGVIAVLSRKEMAEEMAEIYPNIVFLYSSESRRALAYLSALFYPGQPKFLAAVTGTNGKTSTANITRQIWGLLGKKSASIGTIGISTENCQPLPNFPVQHTKLTTLEQIHFHKSISTMNKCGVEFLSLEASSQGLTENRLDGVKFQVGVFTNLTRDHLDYHGTQENYFAAKCYLFKALMLRKGIMIVNNQFSQCEMQTLLNIANEKDLTVWTYGNFGDLHYKFVKGQDDKEKLMFSLWGKEYIVNIPDNFQCATFLIENLLASVGIVCASDPNFEIESVLSTLKSVKAIPGRMELIKWNKNAEGPKIIIDFAHSPGAFKLILSAVRSQTIGKILIVIFGCGGNRDFGKRSIMGEIASQYADHIIITNDNCRYENPAIIRKMILEGISCRDNVEEIGDRREAIVKGIYLVGKNGTLLILGKGAETFLDMGDQRIPFVDKEVVKSILLENKLKFCL